MKLVTVTCDMDERLMLRQAESINLFMSPCEHLVIIEDDNFDSTKWYKTLAKFYNNHKLTIKTYNRRKEYGKGWDRQQVFKLLAAQDCEDKYVVLDSKDFFVKKTNIDEFRTYQGSNQIIDYNSDSPFLAASAVYAKFFNTELLNAAYPPITPFVIDPTYLKQHKLTLKQLVSSFGKLNDGRITGFYKSEFAFYNYLIPKDCFSDFVKHPIKCKRIWDAPAHLCEDMVNEITNDPDFKLASIHRKLIQSFDVERKTIFNKWIKSLGIKTTI